MAQSESRTRGDYNDINNEAKREWGARKGGGGVVLTRWEES